MSKWSYSSLKTFQQCPKKYYHLKVAKDIQQADTEATIYGKEVHKAAEDHVNLGTPIPEKYGYMKPIMESLMKISGDKYCELELGVKRTDTGYEACDFNDPDYWYHGIIDLLVVQGEKAFLLDYKTSKNAKYADTKQLDAMAAATFLRFPQVKRIKAALVFVVSNEFVHKEYTAGKDYFKSFLFDLERLDIAVESGAWNASSSPLCGWCPVKTCVHFREPRRR